MRNLGDLKEAFDSESNVNPKEDWMNVRTDWSAFPSKWMKEYGGDPNTPLKPPKKEKESMDKVWEKLKKIEVRLEKEKKIRNEIQQMRQENKGLKEKLQKKEVEVMHLKISVKKEQQARMRLVNENVELLLERKSNAEAIEE